MVPKLDRDIVLQTLAGYAEVNRITEAERRARLKTMTEAEARALYDDLCASWERAGGKDDGNWDRLNRWRLEEKLAVRRAFEQLARTRALL